MSHHPRRAGKTKYDTWRRLKKGLADVWAVRWMKKNWITYEGVLEVVETPAAIELSRAERPFAERGIAGSPCAHYFLARSYQEHLTALDAAPVTPTDPRPNSRTTLALSLGLLLFTAALLFFAGLGRLPLIEPDEGRNAEVGREMLVSGDWITPHFNGFAVLDKPAVYFWMVAASTQNLWRFRRRRALAVGVDGRGNHAAGMVPGAPHVRGFRGAAGGDDFCRMSVGPGARPRSHL